MPFVHLEPIVAAFAFLVAGSLIVTAKAPRRGAWAVAAALAALFGGFSVWTIATEGPTGFWPNHIANLWGNQVWTDLLLAIGAAIFLVVPRARAAGMAILPWFALIICSGSVGLYAMVARLLWLEQRRGIVSAPGSPAS